MKEPKRNKNKTKRRKKIPSIYTYISLYVRICLAIANPNRPTLWEFYLFPQRKKHTHNPQQSSCPLPSSPHHYYYSLTFIITTASFTSHQPHQSHHHHPPLRSAKQQERERRERRVRRSRSHGFTQEEETLPPPYYSIFIDTFYIVFYSTK